MTDSNGYNQSLLTTIDGKCFICRRQVDTCRHEIFYGTANRVNSKREGMWVNVCSACHNKIHANPQAYIALKQVGQRSFEALQPRAEFIKIFGRNYLDD